MPLTKGESCRSCFRKIGVVTGRQLHMMPTLNSITLFVNQLQLSWNGFSTVIHDHLHHTQVPADILTLCNADAKIKTQNARYAGSVITFSFVNNRVEKWPTKNQSWIWRTPQSFFSAAFVTAKWPESAHKRDKNRWPPRMNRLSRPTWYLWRRISDRGRLQTNCFRI